jgi:hypothetical protein
MRRLLASVVALAAVAPATAEASWSAPFDLSLPGELRREARVAAGLRARQPAQRLALQWGDIAQP